MLGHLMRTFKLSQAGNIKPSQVECVYFYANKSFIWDNIKIISHRQSAEVFSVHRIWSLKIFQGSF